MPKYFATYRRTEFVTAETADALRNEEDRGAVPLEDIIRTCVDYEVGANLRDVAGFKCGHVDANGNFQID